VTRRNDGEGVKGAPALRSDVVTIPNILSVFRILLVPLFLGSLLNGRTGRSLLIFCIAGITDLLDGIAARAWHQRSRLGTVLDPAGDKLLMAVSYVALTLSSVAAPNHIPLWLTATVFLRDLLIVSGALYAYLAWRQKAFLPSFLGKISTGCQIGTVFFVLLSNYRAAVPWYMPWVYGITMFWTLASGLHYFVFGLAELRRRKAGRTAI
jgi:cardiolipin synthase